MQNTRRASIYRLCFLLLAESHTKTRYKMSEQTITQRATSTTVSLTPELAMMLIRYISTSALDGRDFQLTINTMTALHQSDSTEDPIATLQVGESISQTLYPRLKQSFSTITGQDVEVHYNGAVGA